MPQLVPPLPVVTMESKIQDCMQLSVQQFLALLDNYRCAIGPCKGHQPGNQGHRCPVPYPGHSSQGGADRPPR